MPAATPILFAQMPFVPGLAGTPADVLISGEGFDPAPRAAGAAAAARRCRDGPWQRICGRGAPRDPAHRDPRRGGGPDARLPIAAGEDHRRQTVRLVDADGTVLAEAAPAFREHHLWYALLLPAALLRPGMALVVTDGGDGFGEWVAVGEPRWIAPPETGGRF